MNELELNKEQVVQDIRFIKEIMINSTSYTNLSGIAGILSGIAALAGCLASHLVLKKGVGPWEGVESVYGEMMSIWGTVFVVAVLLNMYFTLRKARCTGQPAWSRLARLILYALSPPLILGGFLTFFLICENMSRFIPGVWMMMYGLGVWSAGLFSIREARWLGAVFMITGMLTLAVWSQFGLLLLGISFGGYHLLYGLRLYLKYGG